MSYIIEVKEIKSVKVGERFEDDLNGYRPNAVGIFEDKVTSILRQEVQDLDLKELVKLLNKIV